MGIEVVFQLPLFGIDELPLGFSLPTPFRRRSLSEEPWRAHGEELPGWPHWEDTSFNATHRRALGGMCADRRHLSDNDLTVESVVEKAAEFFSSLPKLAMSIAPLDVGFAFEASGMLGIGISGEFRFQLERSAHMTLTLAAGISFLGISLEGRLVLSTRGGIVEGLISGKGKTPDLGPFLPKLEGELTVKKTPDNVVSVKMMIALDVGCFHVGGHAMFDTDGGLTSFGFAATNPMCFVKDLVDTIFGAIPPLADIIGNSLDLGIRSVSLLYSGGSISLSVACKINGQNKDLMFVMKLWEPSVAGIIAMVMDNAAVRAAVTRPLASLWICSHASRLSLPSFRRAARASPYYSLCSHPLICASSPHLLHTFNRTCPLICHHAHPSWQVLVEAMDDVLNIFTLTFIDITITHPELDWEVKRPPSLLHHRHISSAPFSCSDSTATFLLNHIAPPPSHTSPSSTPRPQSQGKWGDSNILSTGAGVEAEAVVRLKNSAWARVGLFGGGFGVNLDDRLYLGGTVLSRKFELFDASIRFQLDATVKNPLAEE